MFLHLSIHLFNAFMQVKYLLLVVAAFLLLLAQNLVKMLRLAS